MQLLNLSLQHHRPSPMADVQAAQVAAAVLASHRGDVVAAVAQLMDVALINVSSSFAGGGGGDGGGGGFGRASNGPMLG